MEPGGGATCPSPDQPKRIVGSGSTSEASCCSSIQSPSAASQASPWSLRIAG
jgi:hypothetical protein